MQPVNSRTLVGIGAIVAPALHTLTDFMEVYGGGFSTVQLAVNYVAFVAMPFVMLGLFAMQRPKIGLGRPRGRHFIRSRVRVFRRQPRTRSYALRPTTLRCLTSSAPSIPPTGCL
jgi:hypothetical protein